MMPLIPVSWGELIDRLTILEIKSERLGDATARGNVAREIAMLSPVTHVAIAEDANIAALKSALKSINEALWEIENEIRAREAHQQFDAEFIRLARSVYRNNDERGRLKREINRLLASEIVEEKQYTNYPA